MTAALIQKCNKCTKPFVKESGCNKMTCSCGNLQCYVCGESIRDYKHFEVVGKDGKKCPLHENSDTRLDTKIRRAHEDAVKKVLEEEEGLNEEDVKVDIPTVKQPPPPPPPLQQQYFHLQHQQHHAAATSTDTATTPPPTFRTVAPTTTTATTAGIAPPRIHPKHANAAN